MSSTNSNDITNKEKIKNLKIHADEIDRIVSKKNIIHKKIQLWTNDKGNEYAISLLFDSDSKVDDTKFIASTNPNEEYTHPIAETDSIQTLEHGWNYALRELIGEYKENRFQKVIWDGLQSIKLIPFINAHIAIKNFLQNMSRKSMNLNGIYSKISNYVCLSNTFFNYK